MITHLQISLPGFEPCKRTTRCLQTRATGRKSNTNTVDAKEVATRRSLKDTAPLSVPSKSPEVEDAAQASLVIDREARTPANGPSPPAPAPPEEPPSATPSSPAPKKKSSSTTARSGRGRPRLKDGEDPPTELIFKLERRGDGWGEEFIPHITVENRPLEPSGRGRRRRQPAEDDEEEEEGEGSSEALEKYLIEVGVPPSEIERLVSTAIAWRVTPGGRPLIDRRRESRLARNVRIVAEYLEVECGVSFGPKGVGAVFTQVPELMLCKPTSNDRWDRRAVDLAAFRLQNGHCNVPETWEPNVELGIWVKRQRVARAAGQLSSERLKILERMGFEFGDLAQITEEWEQRFDQLIDWMLWHGEHRQTFSWVGIDWGERGGITARELALWMALQREFRRRQLLPGEAIQRFEALQVEWDSPRESQAALEWMEWLGRLVYAVERRCRAATARPAAVKLLKVPKRRNSDDDDDGDASEDAEEGGARWGGPSVAAGHTARARLGSTVASRRAAVASAPLSAEDPGLSFWVARQRWMWRQGRLPAEQVRMLNLAGVDMDAYTPTEWQAAAHTAAEVVQGSRIALGLQMDFKPAPVVEPASQPAEETIGAAEAEAPVVKPQRGRPRRQPPAVVAPTAAEEGRAKRPAIPAQPLSQPPGSLRLRTRRWVQTQRALFTDGRLSPGQLRYLAFLGITWVLSDEVTMMREDLWRRRLDLLAAASSQTNGPRDPVLQEWLQHQRGLRNLELLPPHRQAEVEALGVGWEFERSAAEDEWDLRLSQLLVQSVEEGNLNVTTANERFRGLAEWLAARMEDACRGLLPLGKVAQLKALGVAVPAPVEQVQKRGA